MTPTEQFIFLAKRYKKQAEEDVEKWTAFLEKHEKTGKDAGAKLACSDGLDLLDSLREALNELERQHNEDEAGVSGWQIGLVQSVLTALELKLRKQD